MNQLHVLSMKLQFVKYPCILTLRQISVEICMCSWRVPSAALAYALHLQKHCSTAHGIRKHLTCFDCSCRIQFHQWLLQMQCNLYAEIQMLLVVTAV